MKFYLVIISVLISIECFPQKTGTQLIRIDTLNGVDTLEFRTPELKRNKWLSAIQIDFYPIADNSSSDSIYGQSSLNNVRYYNLEITEGNVFGFPSVKSAISGETGILLDVVAIPNPYYGWLAIGVAGDTTILKTYYFIKE